MKRKIVRLMLLLDTTSLSTRNLTDNVFSNNALSEPEDITQQECDRAEKQWVDRCRSSAIIVTIAWLAWVLVVQVFLTNIFPMELFVRTAEQGEYTGW